MEFWRCDSPFHLINPNFTVCLQRGCIVYGEYTFRSDNNFFREKFYVEIEEFLFKKALINEEAIKCYNLGQIQAKILPSNDDSLNHGKFL